MTDRPPQTPEGAKAPDPRFSHPKRRPDDARGAPAGPRAGTEWEGRRGNLPFQPTEEQRLKARTLAKAFPPAGEYMIARMMGISRDTLRRHFADDMEMGRAELIASVASQVIARALNANAESAKGDLKAQMKVLEKLGGWNTRVELTGRDGGPIEHVDLSRLNAEQLEQYGRLSAIAAGMDPDLIVAVPRD